MECRRVLVALPFVAAFVLGSCTSLGTDGGVTTPDSSAAGSSGALPSPVELEPLRAKQPRTWKADPSSWTVTLIWGAPVGAGVASYTIERNGKKIAEDVDATHYVDLGAIPGTKYRYTVTGVDQNDIRTEPTDVVVKTSTPPVADARLEGRFGMKMHVTSQSGLVGSVGGGGMVFVFDPRCAKGPCDVIWQRQGFPGSGPLRRARDSYRGTVHAPFLIRSCHGGSVAEILVISTTVAAADVVHGQWRATKVTGTLDESAPASGCVTGRISWSFVGRPL